MKRCGCCGELKKMAGFVPLPKTGDITVCSLCLSLFKREFKKLETQGKGRYYDLTVSR